MENYECTLRAGGDLEAQALRDPARDIEAAEPLDWRRTFRLWRSGKTARALIANGMPEAQAVATTARRLLTEPKTVTAQLQFQEKAARKRTLKRRDNEALRLAKQGVSLRNIATRIGLSKSRVQQILEQDSLTRPTR